MFRSRLSFRFFTLCVFSFKSNFDFCFSPVQLLFQTKAKLYWRVQLQGSNGEGESKVKQGSRGSGEQIQGGKLPSAPREIVGFLVTQDIFEEIKELSNLGTIGEQAEPFICPLLPLFSHCSKCAQQELSPPYFQTVRWAPTDSSQKPEPM